VLGIVLTIEKMNTTQRFSRVVGGVMVATGASLLAASMV